MVEENRSCNCDCVNEKRLGMSFEKWCFVLFIFFFVVCLKYLCLVMFNY